MYFSHIYLNIPFNYVFLSRLLYSAKGISATDILPVICLGSDVVLNKSKFIIIIIIIKLCNQLIVLSMLSFYKQVNHFLSNSDIVSISPISGVPAYFFK